MATLTEHLATLTTTLRAADPVSLRFRRGTEFVDLTAANGKDLRWPYNGSADPPVGKRFWLPRPLTLDGVVIKPREGDALDLTAPAALAGRRFELVPFGEEPPCATANGDTCWRVNAVDTTDAPRRDTVVDLEIPDPDATRASSGNKDRTAYVPAVDGEGLYVRLTPEQGSEEPIGGKLQQVRIFRVTLAARNVPSSGRFKVRTGWLEDQRRADEVAGKSVPAAVYLSIESVSRESAYGLETTCLCRCVGG